MGFAGDILWFQDFTVNLLQKAREAAYMIQLLPGTQTTAMFPVLPWTLCATHNVFQAFYRTGLMFLLGTQASSNGNPQRMPR